MHADAIAAAIRAHGWVTTPPVVAPELLDRIATDLASCTSDDRGGLRNPFEVSGGVHELARCAAVRAVAECVLERMLAVRVHLDNCMAENGPVRVMSGSHTVGKLAACEVDEWRARSPSVDCLVARGGILAFRPLLLHASSPAIRPGHRRVVHLEFAVGDLPDRLDWRMRL